MAVAGCRPNRRPSVHPPHDDASSSGHRTRRARRGTCARSASRRARPADGREPGGREPYLRRRVAELGRHPSSLLLGARARRHGRLSHRGADARGAQCAGRRVRCNLRAADEPASSRRRADGRPGMAQPRRRAAPGHGTCDPPRAAGRDRADGRRAGICCCQNSARRHAGGQRQSARPRRNPIGTCGYVKDCTSRGEAITMRVVVLLLCIVTLGGCEREKRELRLDPPVADALDKIALMPNRIAGAPPQVYFALDKPNESNAYNLSEGKRLYSWFGCKSCHGDGEGGIGTTILDGWWYYGPEMVSI